MKEVTSYYSGNFQSQFKRGKEFEEATEFAKGSKSTFHSFELLGKFEFFNAKEISEKEYLDAGYCDKKPEQCNCILHDGQPKFRYEDKQVREIEIFTESSPLNGTLKESKELKLVIDKSILAMTKRLGNFSSHGEFGKFDAPAFIKVVEQMPESEADRAELATKRPVVVPKPWLTRKLGNGCFGGSNNPKNNLITKVSSFLNPSNSKSGCMRGVTGCAQGNGCFNSLGRLMSLLFALGMLFYLLSMLRNCERPTERVVYIHDTIQEVRYDTVNVIQTTRIKSTDKIELPNVQFKTDSDELLPGSIPDIQKLGEFLARNDSVTAIIQGHTDDVGDDQHNMALSLARAESVKEELVRMGIDPNRIKTEGYGETRCKACIPAESSSPDTSPEGRLINRRVEVQLENMDRESETVETERE